MTRALALTWQLSEVHGWGLVGVHSALLLVERRHPLLLLDAPALSTLRPENRAKLAPLLDGHRQIAELSTKNQHKPLRLHDCTVLHALSNGFETGPASDRFQGDRNIGVIAFEDTLFDADILARARRYDRLVVHSAYNRDLLLQAGFAQVDCALQGVDPDELPILPPRGLFGDRFVIFSGGKLEFRKGQDLVLAAFRAFHARHPDSVLVTAWHNPWPQFAASIAESPHTPRAAAIDPATGRLRIADWAADHGVPPDAFVDAGFLGRGDIAPILAECHAAVFPNRCEGATNLVAMEAMACGVPVILSNNTGHRDLIRPGNALPLANQRPVSDPAGRRRGWGESSVEEIVEHLERLYADRAAARAMGAQAMDFIRTERSWRAFAESFVAAVA